ncbi:Clp protease N-terminal domain-containing protein [Nocardia terrae]|uniref:Clp protease N-terminal domain-containing protein n=1 Tax=Nocardia terrae TaxID=2675851 RepID=UPI0012FAD61F|nr:Clp protease N-terminal domain-containing protein [Nocardia terrae]
MFERFTLLAQRAVANAQDAALALGHDFIGAEHLLLGLCATAGTGSEVLRAHGIELEAVRDHTVTLARQAGIPETRGQPTRDALATLGIDVDALRQRADASFGPGVFRFPRPAFTPGAQQVLATAVREAGALGSPRVDTEHLLLGLLHETDGLAHRLLTDLTADHTALRTDILTRTARRAG